MNCPCPAIGPQAPGRKSISPRPTLDDPVSASSTATRTGRTRLELTPITGRSHQLGPLCLALGHPIIGDPLYGKAGERLLLHARRIAFAHPLGTPLWPSKTRRLF